MKKYICAVVTDAFINKICRKHPKRGAKFEGESVVCQNQRYHTAGSDPLQKCKAKYLFNSFLNYF